MVDFGTVIGLRIVLARDELNVNKGGDEESEVANEDGALGAETKSMEYVADAQGLRVNENVDPSTESGDEAEMQGMLMLLRWRREKSRKKNTLYAEHKRYLALINTRANSGLHIALGRNYLWYRAD
ncbi:hypothetical protein VKT23_012390 [Stygiomarasmius scandens]|uniref:Uncharacterized protein n=1 Tax=Marasmiellus scandens TaxID=2682957 RepID=A0ABR1J9A1_9AGAR